MRKHCRKQTKKQSEIFETVELVDTLVSHKLKNINVILPVLITILTSILAYFFTSKFDTSEITFVASTTIYGLFIFAVILWAYLPIVSRSLKKTRKKNIKTDFSPSDLARSAYMSDTDFIEQYKIYFNRSLTQKEQIAVSLLKNKINEMRFRTNCLCIAFGLLLSGIVVVIALLCLGLRVNI